MSADRRAVGEAVEISVRGQAVAAVVSHVGRIGYLVAFRDPKAHPDAEPVIAWRHSFEVYDREEGEAASSG